ncbi:MAG: hypothetical protein Q9195_004593 [Heterodermia aff. obscurata]
MSSIPSISRGVVVLILSTVVYLSLLIVYRLFFHPLARIPGPLLWKVSGIPRMWQCYKGNRHICEWTAHEKYGSAIRIAPDALAFSSLSALQTIHAKDANVFKGDEFYGLLDGGPNGGRSVQMTANNEAHATRRRVLNKALPSREYAFRSINELARNFADAAGGHAKGQVKDGNEAQSETRPTDINVLASWYSFDVIGVTAFGKSFDMLQSKEYRWVPGCLMSLSIFIYWAGFAQQFLGFWRWLLGTTLPSLLRMQTIVDTQIYADLASDMLTDRQKRLGVQDEKHESSERSDIFRHLLNTNLYSYNDLRADSSLLIAAGSDANRMTIAATIFYWLRNPIVLERVVEEIRSCVSFADEMTDSTLSSLRYLRACVDESMRLCPPKASSLPREVMDGGITVDGIHVPKGMIIGSSIYALHHDPDIYPEPFRYNPDRWLKQHQDRRMREAFSPFLKGPRMCPGQTVAYFAIQLALFHLLWRFDLRDGDEDGEGAEMDGGRGDGAGREDEYQFKDWILGYADGPMVELVEREL